MTQAVVTLSNPTGLHARPASELIKAAAKFQSKIVLNGNGKRADAKSIIMVLALGLKKGDSMTISADGPDETEAISALQELAAENFHEE